MKVLVTGANGFIGRQCLPKLLQRGFHVCAISSQDRRSGDVEWRRANLLNAEEMRVAVASLRPTHLLHLAWITTPGVYWTSPENLQWLAASLQLIEEFRSRNGMRAVVAGTCAEYDWTEGVCSETTTALRPATLYGTCKHALQQVLASLSKQRAISAAWGRIFFTYGPDEHPSRLIPSVVGRLLSRVPVECTTGTQRRDFLFVEDVADALVALLVSEASGAVNIASGRAVAIRDVVMEIAGRLQGEALINFGARPSPPGDPELLAGDPARLTELGWAPRLNLSAGPDLPGQRFRL